ncbi:hypothetical protein Acr_28g0012800 [Actinidia rufa]|uniref:Uncharacterized protein n=1 Tax=Actinidia rufa TaxID=165716 RepID=A0A7J0HC81_9ERIC|nr:hypothetical protein Acr_28g0012800 [Actinidia rufa]
MNRKTRCRIDFCANCKKSRQQEQRLHANCVHQFYEEMQQEQKLMEMRRKNLLDPGPRDFSRLLSFVEVDNNSFLSPWNWKAHGGCYRRGRDVGQEAREFGKS